MPISSHPLASPALELDLHASKDRGFSVTMPGWHSLGSHLDPQQDVDDLVDRVLDKILWRLESHYDLHQSGLTLKAILAERRAMWAIEEPG